MKKILAIDNNLANLTSIAEILTNNINNCAVKYTQSGEEGISLAIKEQPDTILLDLSLEETDGYEICKKLKRNNATKHIPIIVFISVHPDSSNKVKALHFGADAFISKPIEPLELITQINVMLRIKKAEENLRIEKDITQKNKTEKALKLSEDRFRKAFKTSPDSININRIKDGVYVSINDGFTKMTGYTELEVIGKSSIELNIWENPEDRERLVTGLKTKGTVENLDAKFKTKSGEIIDGLMSATIIDLDGIPHNINITRNITQRRKAEESHRESERKLNTLINNLQGIVYKCKLDKNWTMVYLSAGFDVLTGYKSEQVINNKEFTFNDLILQEDQVRVFNEASEALKTKKQFEIKYRIKTASGEIKYVTDRSAVIFNPDNNAPIFLEGFIVDNTAQVKADKAIVLSEEKFRLLAKNSVDCIWTLDKNLKFTYLSSALQRITGFKPEEWNGTKLKEHFSKNEFYRASSFVTNAIRANKKHSSILFETKIINNENLEIDVEFSGNLMLDFRGKLIGLQGTIRDISDRIISREAIIESERKFKDLANLLPQIVYETELNGKITYINQIGLKSFGYSQNEFQNGLNILQGIAPEDRERAKHILNNIHINIKGNPEYNAIRKDGSTFPILIYSSIIYKKEKPAGIRGVIIDITHKKKAENALKENEQKLRLIINNSPIGVSTTDLEGNFIDVNPALCKITGYSKNEMIHNHFNSFSHPEDKNPNKEKFEKLVKGEISFFEIEKRYIHKNGNIIYVLIKSQLITDHSGNPLFQTAVVEDITERKRAEQIQKVIYNISNAAVTSVDLQKLIGLIRTELGTIIDTTNFFVALYDENTQEISLPFFTDEKDKHSYIPQGKTLTKYVIDTQKSLLANVDVKKKLVKEGKLEFIGSLSKIWLGVPLKSEGKVTGVLAVQSYKDENAFNESDVKMLEFVSEQISISIQRKKAETELKYALEKANESDRLKSSFLATISHELRTPLNAIIGFSEFLDNKLSSEDVEKFGQIINSSGLHLLSIVNDLFDITLIESGETKLKKEDVRIKTVLQDVYSVIENYNTRKDKSGVEFNLEIPYGYEELIIKTDANKLKQILINLLKNAFKFTESGYIKYGYNIKEEQDEIVLLFYVEDSGIGISEDKQELIFDIFRQVEDSNTRRFGGTGIGLSVAKRLAELLGGKIWLNSEPEKGSTFFFTIPAEKPEMLPQITINPIENIAKSNNKLILIAEDDDSSYMYLSTILDKIGIKNIRAENGKLAVDICMKNKNISLILMDINMPLMNGYEATKIIKSKFPDLPIIAQTAYAVSGDREKVYEAGCDEYISKPIKQDILLDKIEKIFAKEKFN